jgi:hypothetical protein
MNLLAYEPTGGSCGATLQLTPFVGLYASDADQP